MADKKMSQLEELGTSLQSSDIMHIVTDPANNPVNRKGSISDIFGTLNHTTTSSESTGKTFINSNFTVGNGIVYSGNLTNMSAKTTVAPTSNTYIPAVYGQKTNLTVSGVQGWYTGDVIGHEIVLDVTDSVTSDRFQAASHQYGLKIMIQDSSENRATSPSAFICLNDRTDSTLTMDEEDPGAVTTLLSLGDRNGEYVKLTQNAHLFEAQGALMAENMNAYTIFTETDNVAKIKIKVNGSDYYLLATSNNHYAPTS
jgi:hypothetical protein